MAAKNIVSLISRLTIWLCPCVESSSVLLEEGVCYDQCIPLAKLFALLHFVLQGQICLLLQVSLGISAHMPESKEELKNRLITLKEESVKVDLKLNIQKLRLWHLAPFLENRRGKSKSSDTFSFLDLQCHCRW